MALMVFILLIGFLIFSIVAVVKAFTKRTVAWILTGIISGFISCYGLVNVAIGFMDAAKGIRRSKATTPAKVNETVHGRNIAYSIQIPSGWKIKRGDSDFDTLASTNSLYVGVITEEANLGNPEVVVSLVKAKMNRGGKIVRWYAPEPMVLDGRACLQFSAECLMDGVPKPFHFQYYVYSGEAGTYQVIGWTTEELFNRDVGKMREVMDTFHFPK